MRGVDRGQLVDVIGSIGRFAARDTAPMRTAGVTKDGEKCTEFAECMELVEAGEDIDYDGKSGPIELDENGDPQQASFAILQFNDEAQLETLEFIIAGGAEE